MNNFNSPSYLLRPKLVLTYKNNYIQSSLTNITALVLILIVSGRPTIATFATFKLSSNLRQLKTLKQKHIKRIGGKEESLEGCSFYCVPQHSISEDMPPKYISGTEPMSSRQFFTHIPYRLFLVLVGLLFLCGRKDNICISIQTI